MKRKFACFVASLVAAFAAATLPAAELTYQNEVGIPYRPESELNDADGGKERCRLDLYRPENAKGFPTVVYYHGGGLRNGDRSMPTALKNRGWAVVGSSYRLERQGH